MLTANFTIAHTRVNRPIRGLFGTNIGTNIATNIGTNIGTNMITKTQRQDKKTISLLDLAKRKS